MASMMVLSNSVPAPSISRRICLPQDFARSRTSRGSLFQTTPMGCMRVFITPSCSSVVMRFKRCEVAFRVASSWRALNCRIWLRASTSSPTRFMSLSSRPTSTRMVESEMEGPFAVAAFSAPLAAAAESGHGAPPVACAQTASRRLRRSSCVSGPSAPVCSMATKAALTTSTDSRMRVASSGFNSRFPSRSWLRRLSVRWVTASSLAKPRKPQVPLTVWKARKIPASRSGS